jgi:hypothetical protein
MSLSRGFFRGPGISFSPCNTMKKREPGLKRLRKGNLGALSKNPLENFRISGWLLKRQGGVEFPVCCVLKKTLEVRESHHTKEAARPCEVQQKE